MGVLASRKRGGLNHLLNSLLPPLYQFFAVLVFEGSERGRATRWLLGKMDRYIHGERARWEHWDLAWSGTY